MRSRGGIDDFTANFTDTGAEHDGRHQHDDAGATIQKIGCLRQALRRGGVVNDERVAAAHLRASCRVTGSGTDWIGVATVPRLEIQVLALVKV